MVPFDKENRPQPTPSEQSFINLHASQTCAAIDDPARTIPAIDFRHVRFSYTDDRPILDDVSFQVMRGETLLVLSGSGGGKSTILKLVIGLIKPDAGRILIEGEDITGYGENELNRVRRKIGMQFQNGALFDSLTVYDNIAFRCHENDVPEEDVEQEVRRLLRFVNLEDAIEMMPAELSGGMKIRVGIARALAGRPRIVLLDEPTAGLDPPTARTICELGIKMRDLRDVSSIFVTHGLENVRFLTSTYTSIDEKGEAVFMKEENRLCLINTKIMMLREGCINFYGADEELFKLEDPYIRNFLLVD
ncbi:MAG TPA: ATP-binding cassette domain-containing protein [Pyrinomonadaceae bacterium]|nr:ATP-binding cassette domain-containing protein [Pyrinomonadaceae bacterium]